MPDKKTLGLSAYTVASNDHEGQDHGRSAQHSSCTSTTRTMSTVQQGSVGGGEDGKGMPQNVIYGCFGGSLALIVAGVIVITVLGGATAVLCTLSTEIPTR